MIWISYFLTSALKSFRVEEWKSCLHCLVVGSKCTFLSVMVVQSYIMPVLGGVCVHIDPFVAVKIEMINIRAIRDLGLRFTIAATAELGGFIGGVFRVRSRSSFRVYSSMSSLWLALVESIH